MAWHHSSRSRVAWLVALMAASGCINPLDVFGVEEDVIETESQARATDKLSDKHPPYDPELTVRETFDGCPFVLNKSAAVTRLSIEDLAAEDRALKGTLFATRAEALEALGGRTIIASMEVVNGALKPFNDGLYAAVELLAENGEQGALVNKRALLDALLSELVARHSVAPTDAGLMAACADFAAAAKIGGSSSVSVPAELDGAVSSRVSAFDRAPLHSTVVGFYAWTPELESIFRRDRWLMYALEGSYEPALPTDRIAAVVGVLADRPELQSAYSNLLGLYAGLTNPAMAFSPLDVLSETSEADGDAAARTAVFASRHPELGQDCGKELSWLPPATSPETELFNRMACSGQLSGNPLDALIAAIQSGQIDLTPREDSGWYDRQLYALETLLLPDRAAENDHLLLTHEYKEKLVETFKSLLIQTRETHAKSLGMSSKTGFDSQQSVDLYPLLPVEPFPTFYLRTARAYAFVETLLSAALGSQALESTARLLEDGTRASEPLATELADKIRLLYGLYLVSAASIGVRPDLSAEELATVGVEAAEADARTWLAGWDNDKDVLRDPRVILPVSWDELGGTATYWAVAGVKVLRMHASYPEGYEPRVIESGYCSVKDFIPFEPYMLVEQTLEVTRPTDVPPPTRDEFRALADRHSTLDELRAALEAGG
ncbi:MAG: hypothetical protein JW940_02920 [Polyangiaceae bacterium]|nr:hypothetical protein [Polyangiaceae bacterium]